MACLGIMLYRGPSEILLFDSPSAVTKSTTDYSAQDARESFSCWAAGAARRLADDTLWVLSACC